MKAIYIPQDITQPIDLVDVDLTDWQGVNKMLSAECDLPERVKCSLTQPWSVVLLVDEMGLYHASALPNPRASLFYPHGIVGNALLLEEGMTPDGPDFVDMSEPDVLMILVQATVRINLHI